MNKYELINQTVKSINEKKRVAAYCRVSTDSEDQVNSFESQQRYFRQYIEQRPDWELYEIFADEGISGTNTKKRREFNRMIDCAKSGKIDLIITKEISRFARNTLDSIYYTRELKKRDVGVLFMNDNINTLDGDAELRLAIMASIAQEESRKTSERVKWGQKRRMEEGVVFGRSMLGYDVRGGKMYINQGGAEIVRLIFHKFVSEGKGTHVIAKELCEEGISPMRVKKWHSSVILRIIRNEKYCGDVLLQKTFCTDVISKKIIKNIGQMTQYYMPDHHEGIVSKEQFQAVQAEMARRGALRSPSKTAVTGRSCYTSKYALSDRLVCGECGTLYRRCTWTSLGRKYPVWRCTSRLNYGTKYCHDSPTIKEEPLQTAILAAINSDMSNKAALLDHIKKAVSLELLPVQGQTMSLADIEHRLVQLDEQFQRLLAEAIDAEDKEACNAKFAEILTEQTALKEQKEEILQSSADADRVCTRMKQAEEAIEDTASTITEWNENAVRQIVERVTVLSADEVLVRIKGGTEIKQRLER